jgi:undecaprenyl diphosphate synthase
MHRLKDQIDMSRLPSHIAIIMDGNGRWAKEKGQDRLFGHFHGVESVRDVVEGCAELGLGYLTLYAFSTENWDRPQTEVAGLMELLVQTIRKETETLNKNNIRLHVIGDLTKMPQDAIDELNESMAITSKNTGLNLVMALSYSSRWEIVNAVKSIAQEVKEGKIQPENITQNIFQQHLCTDDPHQRRIQDQQFLNVSACVCGIIFYRSEMARLQKRKPVCCNPRLPVSRAPLWQNE